MAHIESTVAGLVGSALGAVSGAIEIQKMVRRTASGEALRELCSADNMDTLSQGPAANSAQIIRHINVILKNS